MSESEMGTLWIIFTIFGIVFIIFLLYFLVHFQVIKTSMAKFMAILFLLIGLLPTLYALALVFDTENRIDEW